MAFRRYRHGRFRYIGIDIKGRHRNLSHHCRRDVIGRWWLSRRPLANQMGSFIPRVFFRDTAHGFLAWAFATLISTTALVPTTAYLANGAAAGFGSTSAQAARSTDSSEIYVDKLFRAAPAVAASATENANEGNAATSGVPPSDAPNSFNSARPEILRLWTADFRNGVRLQFERQKVCCASCCRAHGHEPSGCREACRLRRE